MGLDDKRFLVSQRHLSGNFALRQNLILNFLWSMVFKGNFSLGAYISQFGRFVVSLLYFQFSHFLSVYLQFLMLEMLRAMPYILIIAFV